MIDKIDAWQVFWSILSMVISYIAIMITLFRKEQKELRKACDMKVSVETCREIREKCSEDCAKSRLERARYTHTHGQLGNAGEVIK
jgi:hypothetical protein